MRKLPAATVAMIVALVAALPAGAAATRDGTSDVGGGPRPLIRDLRGWEDRTVVTDAAHLPVPELSVGIGPGSPLYIEVGGEIAAGCTANFVWTSGTAQYLGSAGHCFDFPGITAVYACVSRCYFGGFTSFFYEGSLVALGPVAYARAGGIGSDFGLVTIPAGAANLVRPRMPVFGGPTSVELLTAGTPTCHYGGGVVFGETFATMGRVGIGVASDGEQWFALHPSSPGDSGSAVVTCGIDAADGGVHGRGAVGILTHGILLFAGPDTLGTTTERAIEMACVDAGLGVVPLAESGAPIGTPPTC